MPSMIKTIVITTVAVIGGCIAIAPSLENRGEANARAFCSRVSAGRPAQEVVAMAEAAGKRRGHLQVLPKEIVIRFNGASPFPWHGCVVKVADGKVLEARYEYLD